jgi:hypothetical protein
MSGGRINPSIVERAPFRPSINRRRLLQSLALGSCLSYLRYPAGPLLAEETNEASKSANATSPWPYRHQVDQFILYSNRPLAAAAQIQQEWTQLKSDVEELLQIDCNRGEYHLVVFDQEQTFREYIQHYFPKIPVRRALFIKHRGPGIIFTYSHDDLLTDLRHEGTHALLTETCGTLPLWLDEGLAEYFETPREQRFAGSSHLKETRWGARLGQMPDLQRLEATQSMHEMGATEYRDSWAWVHFLLHRSQESRDLLTNYLSRSSTRGNDFRFHTQVSTIFSDCRQEFVAHFRSYPVTLDR